MFSQNLKEKLDDDPRRARLKATRCAATLWKEVINAEKIKLATDEAKHELARLHASIERLDLDVSFLSQVKEAIGVRVSMDDSKIEAPLSDGKIFKVRDIFAGAQLKKLTCVIVKADGPVSLSLVGQIEITIRHLDEAIRVLAKHSPVFDILSECKLKYEAKADDIKIAKAKALNEYAEILDLVINNKLNTNLKYKKTMMIGEALEDVLLLLNTVAGRKKYIKAIHPQVFDAPFKGIYTLGGLAIFSPGAWSNVEQCIDRAEKTLAKLIDVTNNKPIPLRSK